MLPACLPASACSFPLLRILALSLVFQESRDVEERLRSELAVASAKADAEAAASDARRRWLRTVFHEVSSS